MSVNTKAIKQPVPLGRVVKMWWPLAASWLLMSIEGPLLNGVIARLIDPEINLASYGGVVLPIALIIEAPIIMLLAASTAMSKDWLSYVRLRKFMTAISAGLTAIHVLIVFTPLYYVLVNNILGVPAEVVEPSRIGLMIMLPWTWAIGYRRFQQGVMIRFGYSNRVMACTFVRLAVLIIVLSTGYAIGTIPGIIVGCAAQALGVTAEAIYAGFSVRSILREHVKTAPQGELFSWKEFLAFYIPLILTSLLTFIAQPLGSAAMSRMPRAIESLAVWGVVSNLVFLTRSVGVAYNEVVVALLDEEGSSESIKRFSRILSTILSVIILLVALTPLSGLWFEKVAALEPNLAHMARYAFMFMLLMPAASVFQSWFQGAITYSRKTSAITESVVIFLGTMILLLVVGVIWNQVAGLYVAAIAFFMSTITRTTWLFLRSRKILRQTAERDKAYLNS